MTLFRPHVVITRSLPRPLAASVRDSAGGAESGDAQRIIFVQLCNPLDPGFAVAFASASSELRHIVPALYPLAKTARPE